MIVDLRLVLSGVEAEKLYTTDEAAKLLGINPDGLEFVRRRSRVSFQNCGGEVLYSGADLATWRRP